MHPEKYNIYGIASVSPNVELGNPGRNIENILFELKRKELGETRFIVFPELCITGYTCADLFFQQSLIDQSLEALQLLCQSLINDPRLIAVGLPLIFEGRLFNSAAIISGGNILGFVPKINIPNYQEFYEKRWFTSGENIKGKKIVLKNQEISFGSDLIFEHCGVKVGVEICEDLWVPTPPSSKLCENGAEIILNLSATDDNIGKYQYIKSLVTSQSGRCRCVYAYASAGNGESSTDLVFSGINLISYDGTILSESERFSRENSYAIAAVDIEKLRNDRRKYSSFYNNKSLINSYNIIQSHQSEFEATMNPEVRFQPHPFIPEDNGKKKDHCKEIIEIQSWGLAQRLSVTRCKTLTIGISGGLDSTLALLISYYTFNRLGLDVKGIYGITMPSHATSTRTYHNALRLMELLEVSSIEISIKDAVSQHFRDLGHDPAIHNVVYENSQARERTQILMDLANKYNGMVLGTGDLSELALGWCTYNGDQISMYNVNAGVPKTLVKYLVDWFAETTDQEELKNVLKDILNTPISPELIPSEGKEEINQKTEEMIGPYELHDFFLFHVLRNGFSPSKIFYMATIAFHDKYEKAIIRKWLINFYHRFFTQQFKRSCMPDGPKVGSVCLSPRGDWRMPSDASAKIWIKEAEDIKI